MLVYRSGGSRTDTGRSMLEVRAMGMVPCPDFGRFGDDTLDGAAAKFDRLSELELLPAYMAAEDETRAGIDYTVPKMVDMPNYGTDALARLWCAEPSVRGLKGQGCQGVLRAVARIAAASRGSGWRAPAASAHVLGHLWGGARACGRTTSIPHHAEIPLMSGGCVGWPYSPNVAETVSLVVLTASALLYSFAPLFGFDEPTRIWLEAVTLAAIVLISAAAGPVLAVWASKERSSRKSWMINCLLVGVIPFIAWAYAKAQDIDAEDLGVYEAITKAAVLVLLAWASIMLGAKLGVQYGTQALGNTAKAPTGVRHTTRNTATPLEKWLPTVVWMTLAAMVVVVVVATYMPADQPTHSVEPDTLFTASAAIMGFAVFGLVLSTLGTNMELIKSIAYTLLPVIAVQTIFMVSLVSDINFPEAVWIVMTAVWLFLLVFATVANRILPVGTDGATNPAR